MKKRTTPYNSYKVSKAVEAAPPQKETGLIGILGFMDRKRGILGWLNLVIAIILFFFTYSGFAQGLVFLPFGFGLIGLYFFYSYVRNSLKVNFGTATVPFNLVLLCCALFCFVYGIANNA
jgi:asparagine N-glycosylation enzyme membrane subunit Stt3